MASMTEYTPVHPNTEDPEVETWSDGSHYDAEVEKTSGLRGHPSHSRSLSFLYRRASRPSPWSQSNDYKAFDLPQTVAESTAMSQHARLLRLIVFLTLELLWLGFTLAANFYVIITPSGGTPITIAGISTSRDALFKSGLSSAAILWQLLALLPVGDVVKETFSGEWAHVLTHSGGRIMPNTDRVSTLTSGYMDQFIHASDRHSSGRYRIAYAAGLLVLVLQTIAPGALSVGTDTIASDITISIGALGANMTFPTVSPLYLGSSGITLGDYDAPTILARELALSATRFEYVAMVEHSGFNFQLDSNNTLFGMPPRSLLSEHIQYKSDAVFYDFECEWLSPTYSSGDLSNANWSFGGDMIGGLDYNAEPSSASPQWLFGLWPLMINSGSGALNGSFAWLVFGGDSSTPIDLSSIPRSGKTFNKTGWYDLVVNIQASGSGHADAYANYSNTASVLFCDPHMELGTVDVELQNQVLTSRRVDDDDAQASRFGSVGNLDPDETSRMLGRSLNGMTWDSVVADVSRFGAASTISQLAFEFALQSSNASDVDAAIVPQSLANISASLRPYTTVAGANAYLTGNVGSVEAPARVLRDVERLLCSWPQWGATVGLVLLVALLLSALIVLEGAAHGTVVPLTLASVAGALDFKMARVVAGKGDDAEESRFEAEILYQKYSR